MGRNDDAAASIRMRAKLARRLSTEIKEPNAANALREIADALDAEVEKLEQNVIHIHPTDDCAPG